MCLFYLDVSFLEDSLRARAIVSQAFSLIQLPLTDLGEILIKAVLIPFLTRIDSLLSEHVKHVSRILCLQRIKLLIQLYVALVVLTKLIGCVYLIQPHILTSRFFQVLPNGMKVIYGNRPAISFFEWAIHEVPPWGNQAASILA